MLAVEAPVRKLAVIAGATLAIAAFAYRPHAAENMMQTHHRLTLHPATHNPKATYFTAFANGRVEHSPCDLQPLDIVTTSSELPPLTFTTRGMYFGCEVEGIESLTPIDHHSYAYSYDERLIQCAPDALESTKTPRTGIVTVDR